MGVPPTWLAEQFGCILRDSAQVQSLMRTQLSASLPTPVVSRKADTSAPVQVGFELDMDDAEFRAWEQWTTYDLFDASLPFSIWLPWGTAQMQAHARLIDAWQATRIDSFRWTVSGLMEIDRASFPRFSGGAHA